MSAETTPVMRDLGNLEKLSAESVEEKNCKFSIDDGKNFLPPRNHDTPPPLGKIMVRLLEIFYVSVNSDCLLLTAPGHRTKVDNWDVGI